MNAKMTKYSICAVLLAGTALTGVVVIGTPSSADPCCEHKKDHEIRVPGFSVSGPNVTVSSTSSSLNKSNSVNAGNQGFVLQNQQQGQSRFYGGGGGGYIGGGPVPTVINNLNIHGGLQTKTITEQIEVPYSEQISSSRWTENVYVLQAVCMDDSGTPHPASRPDPNEQVDPNYNGELFRCMSGTWMQVTMGDYAGGNWASTNFNNGSSMVCGKGEALTHYSGGKIACAAQTPRRNCNERSLLRKFGPGVKVVRIARQEQFLESVTRTRMETRTREITVEAPVTKSKRTLILTGGVGGG